MIVLKIANKIYNKGKSTEVHALKNVNLIVNNGDMVAISDGILTKNN